MSINNWLKNAYEQIGSAVGGVKNWWEDFTDKPNNSFDDLRHYAIESSGVLSRHLGNQSNYTPRYTRSVNPNAEKVFSEGFDRIYNNSVTKLEAAKKGETVPSAPAAGKTTNFPEADKILLNGLNQIHQEAVSKLEMAKSGQTGINNPNTEKGVPLFDALITPVGPRKPSSKPNSTSGASVPSITTASTPEDDAKVVWDFEKEIADIKSAWAIADENEKALWEARLEEAYGMYESIMAMVGEKYGNMMKLLGSEKSTAEQRAAINHAKLLKYLPDQLKSMGLGSLGTSQSAFLKAYNQYNNQLSEAQREYRNGSIEAQNVYNTALVNAMSQYSANKNNMLSMYESAKRSNRDYYGGIISNLTNYAYNDKVRGENHQNQLEIIDKNAEIARNENNETLDRYKEESRQEIWADIYSQGLATIAFKDANEVDNYLKGAENRVSPDMYEALQLTANELKNNIAKAEAEESAKIQVYEDVELHKNVGKNHGYVNDTIMLDVNGEKMKVTTGEVDKIVGNLEQVRALDKGVVFMYDGELYYKAPNGRVVTIESTGSYNDLYNYLTVDK